MSQTPSFPRRNKTDLGLTNFVRKSLGIVRMLKGKSSPVNITADAIQ